jgi:phage shock protein E
MGLADLFGRKIDTDAGVTTFRETQGAVLLDVRTRQEHAGGHIPGSVNLPLDQIPSIELAQSTPLFVYCHSGARSAQAVSWLTGHGFSRVTDLGGIVSYHGPLE